MCLYVKSKECPELQPAEKDITVWKVLSRGMSGGLVTPFQGYPVTDKTMKADGAYFPERDMPVMNWWRIGEGVIHSYVYKKDAEWMAHQLRKMCGDRAIVVEATIPAGTPYIKGEERYGLDLCYGSRQLVLNIEI